MPRLFYFASALLLTLQTALAAIPKITSYSPQKGAPGTVVTISGQNFSGLTDVLFGLTKATVQFASAGQIRAIVPADALSGPISVYTTGGQDSSQSLSVPYFQVAPRFDVFYREFNQLGDPSLPARAVVGDRIYVRGANFDDPNRPDKPDNGLVLLVNGVRATQGAVTATDNLQFIVPAGAGTGPITITTLAGTAVSVQLLYFQPIIESFTPRAAVGQTVGIKGINLTGVSDVRFGSLAAQFTFKSATNVEAVVPAGAANGKLTLTTPGGSYITQTDFLLLPTLSGFSPTGGPPGTVVTIDGTSLAGTTAVRFTGAAATKFTNISTTRITAVVPDGAVTGPISVVTANGTNSSAASFFLAPVISSFTPLQGQPGTLVKISGKNFSGVTALSLGTNALTGFTVDSTNQISFTVPDGAKTGTLKVVGPGGTNESLTIFRVLGNEPSLVSFTPGFGLSGTQVTLRGENLATVTNVTFNGTKAVFAVSNGTNLVATVPAGATTGPIAVTSPEGTFTSTSDFFVGNRVDLRTTLTVTENPAVAYGPLVCIWRITNLGLVPSTNTVGHLTLPAGVTYFDAVINVPFTLNGSDLEVRPNVIDPGETFTFTVRVFVGAPGSNQFTTSVANTITDSNAANNTSNLAVIAQAPRLTFDILPDSKLVLTWSASGTNYVAEQRTQLGTGQWNVVPGNPDNDGANLQLIVPAPVQNGFFRVRLNE